MSSEGTAETAGTGKQFLLDPDNLKVEDKKVTEYLLNLDHPVGKAKAKFFRAVGFSNPETDVFKATMRRHAKENPISGFELHEYGKKYIVDCNVKMPNGRSYCIRTVWNDYDDGVPPKLLTAHPQDCDLERKNSPY